MDAKKWIDDVLEEKVAWGSDDDGPGSGFAAALKSGEVLCKYVINNDDDDDDDNDNDGDDDDDDDDVCC